MGTVIADRSYYLSTDHYRAVPEGDPAASGTLLVAALAPMETAAAERWGLKLPTRAELNRRQYELAKARGATSEMHALDARLERDKAEDELPLATPEETLPPRRYSFAGPQV